MSDVALLDSARTDVHRPRLLVPDRVTFGIARGLIADYLRDWGVSDPDAIAAESRRIVSEAERLVADLDDGMFLDDHQRSESFGHKLCEAAIRLALQEMELTVARRAPGGERVSDDERSTAGSKLDSGGCDLAGSPEAAPRPHPPLAELSSVARVFAVPVVPQVCHRDMRPQPRTRLWKALRRGYWYLATGRLATWWSPDRVVEVER